MPIIEWNEEEMRGALGAQMDKNLAAAGLLLVSEVRKVISTPSRTVAAGSTKSGKSKKILGRRGSNPSKPGEPPHKDFGTLRNSITYEVQQGLRAVWVGSKLDYSLFLEFGTSKMAARPYLRPTLMRNADRVAAMICRAAKL